MVNKVIIVGRLGRDPEIRYTSSGTPVASFSVATDEKWTGQDGNRQSRTEWHNVVAWSRLAEICEQYLKKGKLVYIEGRLQTREWDDKDGKKRRTTEIIANTMQMLSSRGDDESMGNNGYGKGPSSSRPAGQGAQNDDRQSVNEGPPSDLDLTDDDIPF